MNSNFFLLSFILLIITAFPSHAADKVKLDPNIAKPPVAPRHPKIVGLHGDKIEDPYFWLREKQNPEVLGTGQIRGEIACA